jgi:hypothetical protein
VTVTRPLRVQVVNGVYHVTARGNERKPIYRDDTDRQRFLEVVTATLERFGWRCLCYCLMGNHYHLLARTPQPNLCRVPTSGRPDHPSTELLTNPNDNAARYCAIGSHPTSMTHRMPISWRLALGNQYLRAGLSRRRITVINSMAHALSTMGVKT